MDKEIKDLLDFLTFALFSIAFLIFTILFIGTARHECSNYPIANLVNVIFGIATAYVSFISFWISAGKLKRILFNLWRDKDEKE